MADLKAAIKGVARHARRARRGRRKTAKADDWMPPSVKSVFTKFNRYRMKK